MVFDFLMLIGIVSGFMMFIITMIDFLMLIESVIDFMMLIVTVIDILVLIVMVIDFFCLSISLKSANKQMSCSVSITFAMIWLSLHYHSNWFLLVCINQLQKPRANESVSPLHYQWFMSAIWLSRYATVIDVCTLISCINHSSWFLLRPYDFNSSEQITRHLCLLYLQWFMMVFSLVQRQKGLIGYHVKCTSRPFYHIANDLILTVIDFLMLHTLITCLYWSSSLCSAQQSACGKASR